MATEKPRDYVDGHFHVWDLQKFTMSWPTPDMSIHRNFYPGELKGAMENTPVRHAVFVQCMNRSQEEAKWVMQLARGHTFIKGIVAGLDLTDPQLSTSLPALMKEVPILKGARHILDSEETDWITRDDVNAGLDVLASHDLSFDLLVRPPHLKYVPSVVEKHPNVRFVVNHIAKPYVKDRILEGWKEDIAEIAKFPNVYCKISGLVNEIFSETWTPEDFRPYVQHVLDVFTVDRCFFGSDFPVFTLLKASYEDVYGLVSTLLSHYSQEDRDKVFRDTAATFYKLNLAD